MFMEFEVPTGAREELIDVTDKLRQALAASGVQEGVMTAFVPHTTAGLTINENADPDVQRDIIDKLARMFPQNDGHRHAEGNSDAHLKTSFVGQSSTIIIHDGRLMLGRWQSLFFCEFDGPRPRKLWIQVR